MRGITPEDCSCDRGFICGRISHGRSASKFTASAAEYKRIAHQFGDRMLVGAGTVLTPDQVPVHESGGRLIVAPNTNLPVIQAGIEAAMITIPGAATPTEALAGIHAGASGVKVFPAEAIAPRCSPAGVP